MTAVVFGLMTQGAHLPVGLAVLLSLGIGLLAGGLNAENVREAMEVVRPFGLDICSGVRTDGKLDTQKLANFMEAVR